MAAAPGPPTAAWGAAMAAAPGPPAAAGTFIQQNSIFERAGLISCLKSCSYF